MATIGETIKNLVDEHGTSTTGIFILEQALAEAVGKENGIVKIDGEFAHETTRYQQMERLERKKLDQLLKGRD